MKINRELTSLQLKKEAKRFNDELITKYRYPLFFENNLQYIQLQPLLISDDMYEELRYVTNVFNEILWTISKVFRYQLPELQEVFVTKDERYLYTLSKSLKYDHYLTLIGRYDWGINEQGEIKLLEFNSDTPAGLCESTFISDKINQELYHNQYKNPNNDLLHSIVRVMDDYIVGNLGVRDSYQIAFMCAKIATEDYLNVKVVYDYYQKHTTLNVHLDFIDMSEFHIHSNEQKEAEYIYTDTLSKVDVIYRFYPLEWLAEDENYTSMDLLLECIANGKVLSINPPHTMSVHSKGVLALLYEIYLQSKDSNQSLFNKEQLSVLEKYLLPSFLELDDDFKEKFVAKPFFSREGADIKILHQSNYHHSYKEKDIVYQEKMTLKSVSFDSYDKKRMCEVEGKMVMSTYSIGNQFAGILTRVGNEITDKDAYFLPTFISNKKPLLNE